MFEIIGIEDNRWDPIVGSFPDFDIYYMRGYVSGFQIHGDGEPLLLHYTHNGTEAACVVLKRDVGQAGLSDIITPYGYGGFIWKGNPTVKELEEFKAVFIETMKKNGIVSGFFRYHPLLNNADIVRSVLPVTDLGNTIDMDLESREKIFENLTSKNRNMIRKAQKNGVSVSYGRGPGLFAKFIPMYNSTMDRDNASDYYYFDKQFYESIDRDLNDNYLIFYAEYEDRVISMSIILFANGFIHYHLSGSLAEYRHLAPTNLLLHEVALWGADNGFRRFHLGGGVGSGEDNLYKFKQAFNRNSSNRFSIGKMIFDREEYDRLVALRLQNDPDFNNDSQFFPLYRA